MKFAPKTPTKSANFSANLSRPKNPVKFDFFCRDLSEALQTTFKAGPEYSGRTKPKWSIPFDVTTEISRVLGWMESARDELDPSQCQQAVNSFLFSLWWCTIQPAIVVQLLQNLLYSCTAMLVIFYFIPCGKLGSVEVAPFDLRDSLMVTWEDKFTHPNKKACNADEENLFYRPFHPLVDIFLFSHDFLCLIKQWCYEKKLEAW